jgi:predicted NAD-dependent protein-ADP-ribosyltransferase YbiA (DUF1768 family)
MKYNLEILRDIIRRNPDIEIIRIGPLGEDRARCLGKNYVCRFNVAGVEYTSVSQYMKAQHVLLYGGVDCFEEILKEEDPVRQSVLVRDYLRDNHCLDRDADFWREEKQYTLLLEANKAKLSQNPEIREMLLSTGNAILLFRALCHISDDKLEHIDHDNSDGCMLMELRDWLIEHPGEVYKGE